MTKQFFEPLEQLLKTVGIETPLEFTTPPKPEMGDVAVACFQIAKTAGKNPVEMAQEIAEALSAHLHEDHLVERVQAFGPYVNFFLKTSVFAEQVLIAVESAGASFGSTDSGKGKSVMIEYPSNNTHKEFHVGHLRIACIGNALVQLYRASGYKVIPVNYLNDFGAHVAKCLWALQKFHGQEQPPENKQKWLGDIYVEAGAYLRDHEEAKTEVMEVQQQLEARDSSLWPLYEKTRTWSIEKFRELFVELGVVHQDVFYESDIKARAQAKVDELIEKGIATVGERGAIIIDLEAYDLGVAMVRKSDGTGLYLTSDLPLAEEKFKRYPVDESIVMTGQEQSFYFRQLFQVLQLIGFHNKFTHLAPGLVTMAGKKMSSRLGNVVLYEDLRGTLYEELFSQTAARHPEWSHEQLQKTAHTLTMAALKFTIQKHEVIKSIAFDIEEAVSVDGFTGPYILYVIARINSVLRKASVSSRTDVQYRELTTPEEKKVLLIIAEYSDMIQKALMTYNPSVVAKYCFDLAQAYNSFYNARSILSAERQSVVDARLALSRSVKQILQNALQLLTIDTVEEM